MQALNLADVVAILSFLCSVNPPNIPQTHYDVLIIGAGPAGATAALALRQSGLRVGLLDKASFPRDKVCGDAIPGPALRMLSELGFADEAATFPRKEMITSSRLVAPNGKSMTIQWVTKAFNSRRMDFDTFLLDLVKKHSNVQVLEGMEVSAINVEKDEVKVVAGEREFTCQILIGADGANGITAKQLSGFSLDRRHHCAAVRAYCKGLPAVEAGVNEFYLLDGYLPGYFWIFPLENGWVNIGFGMLSEAVAEKNLNLRKTLQAIITTHPVLKKRFAQASNLEKTVGFGLPLGSRHWALSGERYMLAGDAGSLIDPLQGHGIDKAMLSGKLAAEQVIRCFDERRFDAAFLKVYDQEVYRRCDAEFRKNYKLLLLLNRFPRLVNMVVNMAQHKKLLYWMQRWMYG